MYGTDDEEMSCTKDMTTDRAADEVVTAEESVTEAVMTESIAVEEAEADTMAVAAEPVVIEPKAAEGTGTYFGEAVTNTTAYTGVYSGGQAAVTSDDDRRARRAEKRRLKKMKKAKKERKPLSPVKRVILSIATGLLFGVCAGAGFFFVNQQLGNIYGAEEPEVRPYEPAQTYYPETAAGAHGAESTPLYVTYTQSDVSTMVEDVMPAMVSIINSYTETTSFFGQSYKEEQRASGTGFIVSRGENELLIATNNHVVANADALSVTFIDGQEASAWLKGTDAGNDLAVIAVKIEDMEQSTLDAITVAKLGNSETLKLGEPVVAIGNALGYGQSVTTGIVSALNREVTMDDGNQGTYIQTDAAINPGNSGGALLNLNGEVIGINSSKIGGATIDGIGYAIPISLATPIISELMEHQTKMKVDAGEIGYMGISCQEVTADINRYYGLPMGVYVASVEPGMPADAAGILQGDIVVGIDGTKITSYSELQAELQYHAAGTTITVSVMRHEQREYVQYDVELTLGRRPQSDN